MGSSCSSVITKSEGNSPAAENGGTRTSRTDFTASTQQDGAAPHPNNSHSGKSTFSAVAPAASGPQPPGVDPVTNPFSVDPPSIELFSREGSAHAQQPIVQWMRVDVPTNDEEQVQQLLLPRTGAAASQGHESSHQVMSWSDIPSITSSSQRSDIRSEVSGLTKPSTTGTQLESRFEVSWARESISVRSGTLSGGTGSSMSFPLCLSAGGDRSSTARTKSSASSIVSSLGGDGMYNKRSSSTPSSGTGTADPGLFEHDSPLDTPGDSIVLHHPDQQLDWERQ